MPNVLSRSNETVSAEGISRGERAETLFHAGWNCAQAVFASLAPSAGMEEGTALSIAAGFGGGLARYGEACGAVTGAVMALGLSLGTQSKDPGSAKDATYEKVDLFLRQFLEDHQAIACRDLTGCDLRTPEGREKAGAGNLHDTLCVGLVRRAVEIVETLL